MPVTTRPKLPSLATPTSVNFPSDALLSASSVRTPLSGVPRSAFPYAGLYSAGLPSATLPHTPFEFPPTPGMVSIKQEEKPEKTPITPPLAYMDFLKGINTASPSLASPPLTAPLAGSKAPLTRTSTAGSTASDASTQTTKSEESAAAADASAEVDLDSAPTTGSTDASEDCSCSCAARVHKSPNKRPADISTTLPAASPLGNYPLSAPASGPTSFPSLRIPPSPAVSAMGNTDSPVRSPFSARSVKSPFDWDAALKAKKYADVRGSHGGAAHSRQCEKNKTSIRHIREVVTRTVTYTPRMDPAPKGKRRKVE